MLLLLFALSACAFLTTSPPHLTSPHLTYPLPCPSRSLFFYVEHFVAVSGHLAAVSGAAPSSIGAGISYKGAPQSTISAWQLHAAARKLCAEPDSSLIRMVGKDPLTTADALRWRCFDATYAARLLTDGYGFPENEAVIEFLGEIDGVEVRGGTPRTVHTAVLTPRTVHRCAHASPHSAHSPGRLRLCVLLCCRSSGRWARCSPICWAAAKAAAPRGPAERAALLPLHHCRLQSSRAGAVASAAAPPPPPIYLRSLCCAACALCSSPCDRGLGVAALVCQRTHACRRWTRIGREPPAPEKPSASEPSWSEP